MTAQGKNLKFWDQPVPVEIEPMQASLLDQPASVEEKVPDLPAVTLSDKEAEQVAEDTLQHLADDGFCLWRCRALKNQIIMIVLSDCEVENRAGYPAYTLEELEMLDGSDEQHFRFINQAKKFGCTLISVERKGDKVEKL